MGCLFAIFAGGFPRLATLFLWLARPVMVNAAFGNRWFLPLLGIIFLPFTTLMYVILWSPGGLFGWDWFWIVLAVFLDIGHMGGVGYANRNRVPGYTGN
jgi:hypothetical protein